MTETNTLADALVALQAEMPRITKGETARVRSDKGSYSYTYADLADVSAQLLPVMTKLGLAFTARPTMQDGAFVLAYSLMHTSGEREDGAYPLPNSGTPQAIGSAITYARRYCLLAVTGAAPDDEDDDAQAAMTTRAGAPDRSQSAASDPEVLKQLIASVDVSTTTSQLKEVWNELGQAFDAGRVVKADADRLAERMKQRREAIANRAPAPPAEENPWEARADASQQPAPAPVDPERAARIAAEHANA